jgi:hypothetical protein
MASELDDDGGGLQREDLLAADSFRAGVYVAGLPIPGRVVPRGA